jgi:hypothetical protein
MQHLPTLRFSASLLLSVLLFAACGRQPPAADAAKAAPKEKSAAAEDAAAETADVKLETEEAAKLGIAASAAVAARYIPAKQGFAVVLSHDAIAQAVADVVTAQAGAKQSQAVLARMARLAGTAGAESAEARESAVRQAAVDAAALQLAEAKSSAILGQHPPWADGDGSKLLTDVAAGRSKLLRVTFPLGALNGAVPISLRIARLDAAATGERWTARAVWDAPADPASPGRSFFALLQHTDAGEGERLLAWANGDGSAAAEPGVIVPPAAVVLSDGKYWCYVERQPSVFTRVPLDIGRPMADGYFVSGTIKPGEQIVTSAAGLLLARQTNPSSEAE